MTPFNVLTGIVASLPEADIDTDVIFPARFLLLFEKAGLGTKLFYDRRFDESGTVKEHFVLNRAPYNTAQILLTGANFGTGSSREHAVWALADFGIRCVIAPSFGEIFYLNCIKNGLLPIRLPSPEHDRLLRYASESPRTLTVDLVNCQIRFDGMIVPFAIDSAHQMALLEGRDEIDRILTDDLSDILAFEARHRASSPWLAQPTDHET
jgi:3-isopropylmalate/(R)-2-methylmalate dehydratase small subunit